MADDQADPPSGEQLVRGQQPPNPYAVPLGVLVGGAAVPLAAQTTQQPVDDLRHADGGGGGVVAGHADGDGD